MKNGHQRCQKRACHILKTKIQPTPAHKTIHNTNGRYIHIYTNKSIHHSGVFSYRIKAEISITELFSKIVFIIQNKYINKSKTTCHKHKWPTTFSRLPVLRIRATDRQRMKSYLFQKHPHYNLHYAVKAYSNRRVRIPIIS